MKNITHNNELLSSLKLTIQEFEEVLLRAKDLLRIMETQTEININKEIAHILELFKTIDKSSITYELDVTKCRFFKRIYKKNNSNTLRLYEGYSYGFYHNSLILAAQNSDLMNYIVEVKISNVVVNSFLLKPNQTKSIWNDVSLIFYLCSPQHVKFTFLDENENELKFVPEITFYFYAPPLILIKNILDQNSLHFYDKIKNKVFLYASGMGGYIPNEEYMPLNSYELQFNTTSP